MLRTNEPIESIVRNEALRLQRECGERRIAKGYDRVAAVCLTLFLCPLLILVVLASSFQLSVLALASASAIAGLACGTGLYISLGLVHDGSHGNIPRSASTAHLINFLTMPTLGVSTFTYRRAHMAHHAHLGRREKDPQYAPFDPPSDSSDRKNFLVDGGELLLDQPLRQFTAIFREMTEVFQRRDLALAKSLLGKAARASLYKRYSFMGGDRDGLEATYRALPAGYLNRQKFLDWLRLIANASLIAMLFFHPLRWLALAIVIGIVAAAILNIVRTSREHSGFENQGDVHEFNRHHSSNTAGVGWFERFLWYPVPWHALHHAAPRVPFYLLATLNERVLTRLSQEAASDTRPDWQTTTNSNKIRGESIMLSMDPMTANPSNDTANGIM